MKTIKLSPIPDFIAVPDDYSKDYHLRYEEVALCLKFRGRNAWVECRTSRSNVPSGILEPWMLECMFATIKELGWKE